MSKQIWRHTWLEVWTNIFVGYWLAVFGGWLYFRLSGDNVSFATMNGVGLFMTVISVLRQLVLRRFFEHLRVLYIRKQQ